MKKWSGKRNEDDGEIIKVIFECESDTNIFDQFVIELNIILWN